MDLIKKFDGNRMEIEEVKGVCGHLMILAEFVKF